MNDENYSLIVNNVSKVFGENTVLKGVSLSLNSGDYLGLIGENGAGKSTLINIITGIIGPNEGSITINGKNIDRMTPLLAQQLGIFTVHQELSINVFLTVTQNIFFGCEIKNKLGLLDYKAMRSETRRLLNDVGLDNIDPDQEAKELSMADRQMLEFCKAIYRNPKVFILDEATSALDDEQVRIVFDHLRNLKRRGLIVIFVSHRLHELFEICDLMTVLKDGHQIITDKTINFNENKLVTYMTGREITDLFPPKRDSLQILNEEVVIDACNANFAKTINANFCLHKGEILGIGGLAGQGQKEYLEFLFGLKKLKGGKLRIYGKEINLRGPKEAMSLGIGYIPAERKTDGLFITHNIKFNMSFSVLDALSNKIGSISSSRENKAIDKFVDKFTVKVSSLDQLVGELSGGNQQKVVISKWLARNPRILLMNEPTRGIDVGTKKEIYQLIRQLADEGVSIVMISSDTMELINLCDRAIVIYESQVNGELHGKDLTEESLVRMSVLGKDK